VKLPSAERRKVAVKLLAVWTIEAALLPVTLPVSRIPPLRPALLRWQNHFRQRALGWIFPERAG
jgi:hypothetical protein